MDGNHWSGSWDWNESQWGQFGPKTPSIKKTSKPKASKKTAASASLIPLVQETPEEQRIQGRLRPMLQELLGSNYIHFVAQVRHYAQFSPLSKGKEAVKQVKLPGFDRHVWMSKNKMQSIGFIKQKYTHRYLSLMIQEPLSAVESKAVQKLVTEELKALNQPNMTQSLKVVSFKDTAKALSQRLAGSGAKDSIDPEMEQAYSRYLISARKAFFAEELDTALDAVNAAIQLNPYLPQAYEMLGSIYYRLNWKRRALEKWEHALSLDPKNSDLKRYIQKVKKEL